MGQKRIFVERHYNKSRRKSGITDQQLRDIASTVFKNKSDADLETDLKNKELVEVING
ncbi:hypothetical protein SOV92_11800 [Pectobacterium brasiliense]|uniref:Uncharacterized protein n=1 Tax=Pectobacterium brasiliense TaxID=180957 RepID=A0AAW9HDF9_9GAMM|nr:MULTISPECIES: hypothetical protein [Pectobacterium]MDY4378503.1 hypothetical protein [Pectobacterium brasiliense]